MISMQIIFSSHNFTFPQSIPESKWKKKFKHLNVLILITFTQIHVDIWFNNKELGGNYRMTNFQAAVGVAQTERIDEFVKII